MIHFIGLADVTECGAKGEDITITLIEQMVTCPDCREGLQDDLCLDEFGRKVGISDEY